MDSTILFSGDLDASRNWICSHLSTGTMDSQFLHWAVSLRMLNEIEPLLLRNDGLSENHLKRVRFRLARLKGEYWPHVELKGASLLNQDGRVIAGGAEDANNTLRIRLSGGIGDYMQDISLIKWWSELNRTKILLEVDGVRFAQFRRLIERVDGMGMIVTKKSVGDHPLTALGFDGAIRSYMNNAAHSRWIENVFSSKPVRKKRVYCWRAEGSNDKFSTFVRSVNFAEALDYYKRMMPAYASSNTRVVDISAWKQWEKERLSYLGIVCHDPKRGDVLDMVELLSDSSVTTIDTAIVHICASMGKSCNLLLNKYPDERWVELLKKSNNCYQAVRVIQQKRFCSWQEPLNELIRIGLDEHN